MLVKFTLSIGSSVSREEEVELPDDWTEEQIHEELLLWSDDYIDVGFDILGDNDDWKRENLEVQRKRS